MNSISIEQFDLSKRDEATITSARYAVKPQKEKSIIATLCEKGATVEEITEIFSTYPIGAQSEGFTSAEDKQEYIQGIVSEVFIPKSEKIKNALSDAGYRFKRNLCTDLIMYAVNDGNYKEHDDFVISEINRLVMDTKVGTRNDFADMVNVLANDNAYHPIKDYLESLQWDGQDHIRKLAGYLTDKHESITYSNGTQESVSYVYLKRFLVGSIAKIYVWDAQNPMPVIIGKQGDGKSTFSQWLCPLPDLAREDGLDPDNKDTLLKLRDSWIWEVGELGSTFRKADRDALKRLLTQNTVTARNPYGRRNVQKPIVTSFIGTLNEDQAHFLNDPSGNRRFHIMWITDIDWAYRDNVDINQVWAQAYHLFKNKEPYQLTSEEVETRERINKSHETDNPDFDAIRRVCDVEIGNMEWYTSIADIKDAVKTYGSSGSKDMLIYNAIRDFMYFNGATSDQNTKRKGYPGWYGIKLKKHILKNKSGNHDAPPPPARMNITESGLAPAIVDGKVDEIFDIPD